MPFVGRTSCPGLIRRPWSSVGHLPCSAVRRARSEHGAVQIAELESKPVDALRELAREYEISGYSRLKKTGLVFRLLRANAERRGLIFGGGVLEIIQDGIGFLRASNLRPGPEDVYVSQSQIRRFGLRTGDLVSGRVRPPKESERYFSLLKVEAVNGVDPEARPRPLVFEHLPALPADRPLRSAGHRHARWSSHLCRTMRQSRRHPRRRPAWWPASPSPRCRPWRIRVHCHRVSDGLRHPLARHATRRS